MARVASRSNTDAELFEALNEMRVIREGDGVDAEFFRANNVLGLVIDEDGFFGPGGRAGQRQMIEVRIRLLQVVAAGQDRVVEVGVEPGFLIDEPAAFVQIADGSDRAMFSQALDDREYGLIVYPRI